MPISPVLAVLFGTDKFCLSVKTKRCFGFQLDPEHLVNLKVGQLKLCPLSSKLPTFKALRTSQPIRYRGCLMFKIQPRTQLFIVRIYCLLSRISTNIVWQTLSYALLFPPLLRTILPLRFSFSKMSCACKVKTGNLTTQLSLPPFYPLYLNIFIISQLMVIQVSTRRYVKLVLVQSCFTCTICKPARNKLKGMLTSQVPYRPMLTLHIKINISTIL